MTRKLLTMKPGQMTIDEYVSALHRIARDCNLGGRDQYERMIIQALLLGIENDRVRRRLFERQDFSLDEATVTCWAMEAAREDIRAVQYTKEETVHSINPTSLRYDKSKKYLHESCRKCGENHPPRKCKAYGKECGRLNHFAKCCVSKNVKTYIANLVRRSKHEGKYSSDKSTNTIRVSKRDRKTIVTVLVADGKVKRSLEFQLDTAATC